MEGTRSSPVAPSVGSRIRIVYTESWLADREPSRLVAGTVEAVDADVELGSVRESRVML